MGFGRGFSRRVREKSVAGRYRFGWMSGGDRRPPVVLRWQSGGVALRRHPVARTRFASDSRCGDNPSAKPAYPHPRGEPGCQTQPLATLNLQAGMSRRCCGKQEEALRRRKELRARTIAQRRQITLSLRAQLTPAGSLYCPTRPTFAEVQQSSRLSAHCDFGNLC